MAETWYRDSGIWRKAKELHYRDAGTWRKLKEAWYRDGGVWRKVFSGYEPALSNRNVPGDVVATVRFHNDGTLIFTDTTGTHAIAGEWLTSSPGTVTSAEAGAFDVQFTYVSGPNTSSGSTPSGGADKSGDVYGSWLNLASSRAISVTARLGTVSGIGGDTLVFDAAIRPAGGGATLASGRFTLICSI